MAKESRWALNTWSRSFPLNFAAIRLAMARAMMSMEGEDVCGCRMAAIKCVIVSALFKASKILRRSDKADGSIAKRKNTT